jgi:hypothetical protein
MSGNAVAQHHFAALPAGEQPIPTTTDDRINPSRNTPARTVAALAPTK